MTICFFNDEKANRFLPLTLTRPLDDLRVGVFTIREKWLNALQTDTYCRIQPEYLSSVFKAGKIDKSKSCCWINPRFLPSEKLMDAIKTLKENEKLVYRGTTVAAKAAGEKSADMFQQQSFSEKDFHTIEIAAVIHLEHIWDLLTINAFEIEKDLPAASLRSVSESNSKFEGIISEPENTYVGDGVTIEPGCIIIAKEGPVIIQDGATIEAGSIIRGPVVIGKKTTLKMAARISGGTTIGPLCKVGGEVINCIFHSYSNKAHDGFTGNSIFGQWVNLGADTNTSNLKNNYSSVRISGWNSRKEIETENQFLGTIMADHSKTAINTMLNTGTVCGVSSNIFMPGFPPKYVPSFSWVGSLQYEVYDFEKATDAMQAMMKRRDVELTDGYKNMMHHIFDNR